METLHVEKELCIGCGACASIEPNIFEIDDDGLAKVINEEINEDVQMAIDSCPTGAIKTEK